MRFQATQKALLHASNYINGGKTASKAHSEIMNALWWIVLVAGEHHPSLERDTCVLSDSFITKNKV